MRIDDIEDLVVFFAGFSFCFFFIRTSSNRFHLHVREDGPAGRDASSRAHHANRLR